LRRYTMELRLGGIEEAWRARNLRFTASRDLISSSPPDAPYQTDSGRRTGQSNDDRGQWTATASLHPNLFLARMNEAETQAAVLLGIDDPHIHGLAADLGTSCAASALLMLWITR
jgi:hypothetical protein